MDMRSGKGGASGKLDASPEAPRGRTGAMSPPPALRLAAAVQAAEAAMLCVAAVITAVDTAAGRSYQQASGIALTLIAFGTVAALAWIAGGLARLRPWSRTPAVMTQLFTGGVGIYLLEGHRFDWGVAAVLLALAGLAGLLAPASFRALQREINRRS
ncbi:MAG: hypothetical protein JOY82_09045 [Streptosporangiaceae bacterium]|nr:hypothetical protein [Streptosporangiaceae bacterium]MBV9854659.1 hypothetical protein [Streptosporangiaceae bacterium]